MAWFNSQIPIEQSVCTSGVSEWLLRIGSVAAEALIKSPYTKTQALLQLNMYFSNHT